MFGQPCIRTTCISAYDILNWLDNAMCETDIFHTCPQLNETAMFVRLTSLPSKHIRTNP